MACGVQPVTFHDPRLMGGDDPVMTVMRSDVVGTNPVTVAFPANVTVPAVMTI